MSETLELLRGGLHNLPRFLLRVFGLYLAATLACVVLAAPFIDFACVKIYMVQYGLPLFLTALLACAVMAALFSFVQKKVWTPRRFLVLSLGMGLVLLAAQLYLERSAGFTAGWDVSVLTQVGDRAGADTVAKLSAYLSGYPNQVFLYGLFNKLAALGACFGMAAYPTLVRFGCLCVTSSIVLIAFVAKRLFGPARALAFQLLASIFIGLNGWVLVPYSDTYGMLFTCLALWFYVVPRRRPVRLLGLTLSALLGYKVKPTVIFLLFAVACLEWLPVVVRVVRAKRQAKIAMREQKDVPSPHASMPQALAATVLPVIAGVFLATVIGQGIQGNYVTINPDASYGMTHFLAMGINPEAKGVYSLEENRLSASIADPAKRRAAQLDLWKEHLAELGPVGLLKLWFEKNLTNYADGTFAWKMEGDFFVWVYGDSSAVKNWYGISADGKNALQPTAYSWFCQILWFVVLLGCIASCIRRARDAKAFESGAPVRSTSRACAVIALTLIFLSGFLLIFECRARYLFLFSPYYVLLAIDGLVGMGSWGEWLATKVTALREQHRGLTNGAA